MPLEEEDVIANITGPDAIENEAKDDSGENVKTIVSHNENAESAREETEPDPDLKAAASNARRPETINESETLDEPNAFEMLVRGWEAYMKNSEGPSFEPLQMLQHLHFCGPVSGAYPRLIGPAVDPNGLETPASLRHTRSSPLQRGPSIFDEQDSDKLPPPIPLDISQRATSTPSSFRQRSANSAFGKFERGSFAPPPPEGCYHSRSYLSAFDPVVYYANALEDMERTAIEVTDTRLSTIGEAETSTTPLKSIRKGAASRAAKFLADVRAFPRRRRLRGGRENPLSEVSEPCSGEDSAPSPPTNTSVEVITEMNYVPAETSMISQNSELSTLIKSSSDAVNSSNMSESSADEGTDSKDGDSPIVHRYQRLGSDADEEELNYQRIEASIQPRSPISTPSAGVARTGTNTTPMESNRIRISLSEKLGPSPVLATSPSPTQLAANGSGSQDSPHTAHTSITGSSGHTTQAASVSSSVGKNSNLSTISETDREVMEANKESKLRQQSGSLVRTGDKDRSGLNSTRSSSSNSPVVNTYYALNESPETLRDGANLAADRFFVREHSSSTASNQADGASIRSGSIAQTSNGSVSVARTNSTASSAVEPPPKIVSYWDGSDRKEDIGEKSTERSSEVQEDRENSPAEFDLSKLFQGDIMYPFRQKQRRDKFKYLPPRSPVKSRSTPSPRSGRGSVSPYQAPTRKQFSPPPDIVGGMMHPSDNVSVSRPYVLRTIASGEPLLMPDHQFAHSASLGGVVGTGRFLSIGSRDEEDALVVELSTSAKAYEERNVEVTQDFNVRMVTPEKEVLQS